MSELRIYLFGPPCIEYKGVPVELERRKAVALLAYLAVTQTAHSRESLAALLWPDYDPKRAYAYLRNAFWTLNRTPLGDWLDVDRQTAALRFDAALWIDVKQFRTCLRMCQTPDHTEDKVSPDCIAPLEQAVETYQDEFMAGFNLEDSPAFEEWLFFEAEALKRELGSALHKLSRAYAQMGKLDQAITAARHWLDWDPAHEATHRTLMALYAQAGKRTEALRQYEACRHMLHMELNVEPEAETTQLYEAIKAGDLAAGTSGQPRERASDFLPQPLPPSLPTPATPFVGRKNELIEIQHQLTTPACRLLTLVGLGGSGKTRLALACAHALYKAAMPRFEHGIYFVPLAPVRDPAFLMSAIVDTMHIPRDREAHMAPTSEQGRTALTTQFLNYAREKRMLVVLDNVEHVLEEVEVIAEILRHAPGVKILATSRERLNLQGEWVLDIEGMGLPASGMSPPPEAYDAGQLFIQSAQRARVGFSLNQADHDAVARICHMVEGIPLGIELAASWIKSLSCQEIAQEIEINLDFLTSSLRDVPARHRSLRAVFAQSWALLSKEGRVCFRKLAVFQSGFSREAAQEVAGASITALTALLDKSLLRRNPEGHYEMHELLRQYAEERLLAVPREDNTIRDRHAKYYLWILASHESDLKGAQQKKTLVTLQRDTDDLRAAWRWAAKRGHWTAIHQAAMGMFLFYDMRSRFLEGAEMFGEAATALQITYTQKDTPAADEQKLLGLLLTMQAWFLRYTKPSKAERLWRQARTYLEPLDTTWELAFFHVLAAYAHMWKTYEESTQRLTQSLAIYRARQDDWGVAVTLEALAIAYFDQDRDTARAYARQSYDLRRQIGDQWGMALALYVLAQIIEAQGELSNARRYYEESLDLRREQSDDVDGSIACLNAMGRVAHKMGESQQALALHQKSLALARHIGHPFQIAVSLNHLGQVAQALGAHSEARAHLEQSLRLYQDLGLDNAVAQVEELLAQIPPN